MTSTKDTHSATNLDPKTISFLEKFSSFFASIEHFSIPEQRAKIKELFCVSQDQLEPIARIENKTIQGRNGPVPIRFFYPNNAGSLPMIVFFHRGGWVYGSVDESEVICRKISNLTKCIVAAVDYRLSPENKFPIPLEDCYDATKWIAENGSILSGDSKKIILAGESAGGNLASALALMVQNTKEFQVAGQLLIYPVLTSDLEQKYYDESPDKSLLSYENMQFFLDAYLSSPDEGENQYVSPLKSKNLTNLPSCLIITAEYDALKHEGAQYAEALQKAGVTVQSKCYPRVLHGFLDLPLADSIKNEAFQDIADWVKRITFFK